MAVPTTASGDFNLWNPVALLAILFCFGAAVVDWAVGSITSAPSKPPMGVFFDRKPEKQSSKPNNPIFLLKDTRYYTMSCPPSAPKLTDDGCMACPKNSTYDSVTNQCNACDGTVQGNNCTKCGPGNVTPHTARTVARTK